MTKFATALFIVSFTAQASFAQSNGYQPGSAIHFGDTSKYLNQSHSSSPSSGSSTTAVSKPPTSSNSSSSSTSPTTSTTSSGATYTTPKSMDSSSKETSAPATAKPTFVKRNGKFYRVPPVKAAASASIKGKSASGKDMMREDSAPATSTASVSSPPSKPAPDPAPDTPAASAPVETAAATPPTEEEQPKHHRGGGGGGAPGFFKGLKNAGKAGKLLGGMGATIGSFATGNMSGGFTSMAAMGKSLEDAPVMREDAAVSSTSNYSSPVPDSARNDQAENSGSTKVVPKKEKPKPLATDNRPIADKWAIVMGVSKFKDPSIPKLKYAAKDAKDFADFLVKDMHFSRDHIRLLTNEKATKAQFLSEIGDKFLPRVVHRDDLVVLFFSSHGTPADKDIGGSNFVAAYDTDKNSLYSTGIEMQELTRILRERTPKANQDKEGARVCIFMDACHSGGGAEGAKDADESGIAVDKIDVGRGQILVSSSSGSERSWESTRYPNGVFTHYLMAAMKNNVGILDGIDKMSKSIADEVQQDDGQSQTVTVNAKMWQGKKLILGAPPASPQPLPPTVQKLLGADSSGQ